MTEQRPEPSRDATSGLSQDVLPFPIAAAEVSSEGLTAAIRRLEGVGATPGISFVLVSHLDPNGESSLVDILASVTRMPVRAVTDGAALEPNVFYTMSPNTGLLVAGGRLQVVARPDGAGPHMPIDGFLPALAEDPRSETAEYGGAASAERIAETARRSEEALRGMLTVAADGILMRNEAGTVVFANLAISNMLGYSIDEMVGMHVDDLFANPSGPIRGRGVSSPTSSAHTMGLERDRIAIHSDGRQIPVEVVLTPMDAAEGPLTVAFVTNVTVRHEAEKKLLDYQEKLQRMAFDATLADERARRRFAVDVHDRIGQSLAAARLKMVSARERSHGSVRDAIQQAIDLVGQTIADTRALMFDLSPPILYDLGFREALDWLADESEKQHGLHVDITELTPPPDLDETTAAILFRSVRELLMNVVKHSQVRQASVSLRTDGDVYEIEVMDRGVGFEVDLAAHPGGAGFGLFSIREQLSRLRGTIKVVSTPAEGCSVLLRVPPRLMAPEPRPDGAA